jgi:hypothetical protein
MVGLGALVLLFFGIAASQLYTAERKWVPGSMGDVDPPRTMPFASALPACLRRYDPAAADGFARTGRYRVSGWFVREPQTTEVMSCMRQKGRLLPPTILYTP